MKNFIFLTLILLILPFGINTIQAQCTTYAAGPYGDQAIDIAGCDGESVNAPYDAWQNEVYFSAVQAGGNYTFELVGCDAINWGGTVEITVIDGGTDDGAGNITGGTTTVGTGCSVNFTAANTATAYFIVTTVGGCGSAVLETNNGVPTITTNSGVTCATCEDAVCETIENYCSCNADCGCVGASPVFVTNLTTTPAISTVPVVYCGDLIFGANSIPESVLIPFAPFGNQPCVTDWGVTTDFGLLTNTTLANNGIGFVELTDADITASGGIVTITFTDSTTGNGCTFDLVIDMSQAVVEGGAAWAGTATGACPAVCGILTADLLAYDCTTQMAGLDVTDVGTPPAGFDYELYQVNDGSVAPVTITGLGQYMIGPIDPTVSYNIGVRSTGGATDCDVETGALYPDCYSAAIGCIDLLSTTGDMETTGWTEVSDTTNTISSITDATGVPIIDATLPLADFQSAFLGGWAGPTRTSLSTLTQSITFGAAGDPVNMIFWLQITGCDSANDLLDISIDGSSVFATDAVSAYPMTTTGATGICDDGHWYEITVPLGTTFSDGAAHSVVITATEAGTNGANTNFFIDEMIIESCGISGPCPPEYTAANSNRLTGTETGIAYYETDGRLESEQTIDASAVVDYNSGFEIELLESFNTVIGAEFHAYIQGCIAIEFLSENNEVKQSTATDTNVKPMSLKQIAKPIAFSKNINHKNSKYLQMKTIQSNYRSGK